MEVNPGGEETSTPDSRFMFKGECRKADDPEIFFVPPGIERSQEKEERENEAKGYCNRCSVRPECLEWALATGQRDGIWGGLNEEERKPLHRERSRQNHPAQFALPRGGPRKSRRE